MSVVLIIFIRFTGEAMKEKNITVTHVYASPSLRCVETASSLLKGVYHYDVKRIFPHFCWGKLITVFHVLAVHMLISKHSTSDRLTGFLGSHIVYSSWTD